MIIFIVSVLIALTVSFLCSLMEATLLSLTPSQTAEIVSRRPKVGATWDSFKSNIERPIAVILLLNTSAHTIGASVAGAQFNKLFGNQWIWVFSLVFTFLMLQFTEILPKTLGVRFNRELAYLIARPLEIAIHALTPLLHFVHRINKLFEPKLGANENHSTTVDEISALASLARLSQQITPHQERIIKSVSRLSRLRVHEVMIPVEHVSFLSTSQTLPEALVAAHTDAHTRYPVCEADDKDRVAGYVNFKEMIYFMRTNPNDPSFRGVIRPLYFASPDESASALLELFVNQHIHMAIVQGASGKTLGLVTLEDIVKTLVGEVQDEFDRLPRMIHPLSGQMWMVGGGVPLRELAQQTGLELPDSPETISVWLMDRIGQTPKAGDVYAEGGIEFIVRRTRRAKVFEVSISRQQASQQ